MMTRREVMLESFQDEMRKIAVSGKAVAIGAGVLGTAAAAPYVKKRWDAGGKELEESRLSNMRRKLQMEEAKYQKKYMSGM